MATPKLDNVTLTAAEADNRFELNVTNQDKSVLHIDYTKNTEVGMELLIEYSTVDDDDGAEVWISETDIAASAVSAKVLTFAASGKYRLEFSNAMKEDKMRFGFRADTPGATPGTVTVFAVTSEQA